MDINYLTISPDELDQLKDRLGAKLDIYRGKSTRGSAIDAVEYSKAVDCDDLSDETEFVDASADYAVASVDFLFDHPARSGVRLRVSTQQGAMWFRSAVTEDVIAYVFSTLMDIKRSEGTT
jgi:hypothetical protein